MVGGRYPLCFTKTGRQPPAPCRSRSHTFGAGVRDLVLAHHHAAVRQLSAQRDVLLSQDGGQHQRALWDASHPGEQEDCGLQGPVCRRVRCVGGSWERVCVTLEVGEQSRESMSQAFDNRPLPLPPHPHTHLKKMRVPAKKKLPTEPPR